MNLSGEPARRRRGRELENAILDATWAVLLEQGYEGITFEAVAERAGTSRSVLYRRWSTRSGLLTASIARQSTLPVEPAPDTGSLRGDVLALMRDLNDEQSPIFGMISVHVGSFFAETGGSPAEVRELCLGDRPRRMDTVIGRAVERGELSGESLSNRVRDVPFDLLRHEVLMTLRPASEDTLCEIIDDIFLPLVTGHPAGHQRQPRG